MDRELLESDGDTSRFFESSHTALDDVAAAIYDAVEFERAPLSCTPVSRPFLLGNHSTDLMCSEPVAHRTVIVSFTPATIQGRVRGRPRRPSG